MAVINMSDHGSALRLAGGLVDTNAVWSCTFREAGGGAGVTLVESISGSTLVLRADGTSAFIYDTPDTPDTTDGSLGKSLPPKEPTVREPDASSIASLYKTAFHQICDKEDWRAPFSAWVPWELANLYMQAIEVMTGVVPTYEKRVTLESGKMVMKLTSAGCPLCSST